MRFTYRNHLDELSKLAKDIAAFGKQSALDADFLFSLNLCLDEILTNVISYAFDDAGSHEIVMDIERADWDVIVVVSDGGKPFDPLSAKRPDFEASIETRKIGGLGMHFVRTMTNRVEYSRENGQNRLKIVKSIPKIDPTTFKIS